MCRCHSCSPLPPFFLFTTKLSQFRGQRKTPTRPDYNIIDRRFGGCYDVSGTSINNWNVTFRESKMGLMLNVVVQPSQYKMTKGWIPSIASVGNVGDSTEFFSSGIHHICRSWNFGSASVRRFWSKIRVRVRSNYAILDPRLSASDPLSVCRSKKSADLSPQSALHWSQDNLEATNCCYAYTETTVGQHGFVPLFRNLQWLLKR